jgi:transposase
MGKEFPMDKRLFPVTPEFFGKEIEHLIEADYRREGRPPKVSHYLVFCAMLYVLRTGVAWRDLPRCYCYWHTVYLRFKRGSDRGLWWRILIALQQRKKLKMDVVLADSTTFKVHRHGGGAKGGSTLGASTARA